MIKTRMYGIMTLTSAKKSRPHCCKVHRECVSVYGTVSVYALWNADFSRFRWVALQLDELQRCRSPYEVEQQLVNLPRDLYESYDRIIYRIDKRDYENAQKFFQWLAFSIRPVDLAELAEVVTVGFGSQDEPWFDPKRRYYDPNAILTACPGFVSITEGKIDVTTQQGQFH